MNILLTGSAGQLGRELIPLLSGRGSLTATDRNRPDCAVENWLELDLGNSKQLDAEKLREGLLVTARDTTGTTKTKLLLKTRLQDKRQKSDDYWRAR